MSDMSCEEEPETCILKTHELLSKAQLLLRDIEKLLDWCTSTATSNQRRCRTIQQERHASIEEDGETLVIGGFRFESAAKQGGSEKDGVRRLVKENAMATFD